MRSFLNPPQSDFKKEHTFDTRVTESARVKFKYPDRVPVIVERSSKDADIPVMSKRKFLVPNDLTLGQFVFLIRKQLSLPPQKAIFMFIQNVIPPTAMLMSDIYTTKKDPDGFVYFLVCSENTFG